MNTNSVVIPSVRRSNRENVSTEIKWSRNSTTKTIWHGLQTIRDYKGRTSHVADSNVLLPDKLNTFASFEDNTVPRMRIAPKDCGLLFSVANLSKTFKRVNRPRRHPHLGPQSMCRPTGWIVYRLASRCQPLFLYPRKVTELNDYRPAALTSVIMKCFERLVKDHITSTLPDTLEPHQFAYHPNRSTDNGIAIAQHTDLSHLYKRNTYVRMLFIDDRLTFNTIVPSKLIIKLGTLGLNPALCNWVLDFLTCRPRW